MCVAQLRITNSRHTRHTHRYGTCIVRSLDSLHTINAIVSDESRAKALLLLLLLLRLYFSRCAYSAAFSATCCSRTYIQLYFSPLQWHTQRSCHRSRHTAAAECVASDTLEEREHWWKCVRGMRRSRETSRPIGDVTQRSHLGESRADVVLAVARLAESR